VVFAAGLASAIQTQTGFWLLARPFWQDWRTGFISDALGVAMMVPLILSWGMAHLETKYNAASLLNLNTRRLLEGTLAFLFLIGIAWFVFSADLSKQYPIRPYVYLILPPLLWIALRFGLRAVTAGLVLTAGIAIFYTSQGFGMFAYGATLSQALLEVQIYLLVLSLTILLTAALFNEQKITAHALAHAQRRTDAVMRASGNVIFEIDVASRNITWSGDTVAVLGWTPDNIDTVDLWNEKVHADDVERLIGVREKLTGGVLASVALEYRIYKADGSVIRLGIGAYGANFGANFYDAHRPQNQRQARTVIIGIAKDITDISALTEQNRILDRHLRQAQKMESIGQLAGGIAHDFNNILAAILGYGEMAKSKLDVEKPIDIKQDRQKLSRYLETIIEAAERGRLLVAQVLTFSRRSPEQRQQVNLAALVSEVVQLLRGSYTHEIVLDLEARDCAIAGDATALHQLIMNLCTNGLQAIVDNNVDSTNKQGALSILLADIHITAKTPLEVETSRPLAPNHYAVLRIADDGVGMSQDTRAQMFDPFFTTKSVGNGTGLGLSLALSIAHAHEGAIACETSLGNGTTFSVYLPIAASSRASLAIPTPSSISGQGQRVLLVDDEAPLRQLGAEMLTSLGYTPIVFESSEDAWRAFAGTPNDFDLVLTDEVMPQMTGTQLATRIRTLSPNIPILVITAYGGAGFQLRAEAAGVDKILKKPYRRDDLALALSQVLEMRR
jgi:signal transduction histidine kinase/ActR/RegA family two-component response regulator